MIFKNDFENIFPKPLNSVADPGGCRRRAPPPQGSRFFRFDIQNFRNVAASGVGAPPYEVGAPPTGNPGSAAEIEWNFSSSFFTDLIIHYTI